MSSVEIEDVLSSIRRLVSEDLRPSSRANAVRAALAAAEDKLILTPALRVVASNDAAELVKPATETLVLSQAAGLVEHAVMADEPDEAAELWSETELPASPTESKIGAVVTALGAAVDAQHEEWEPASGDMLTDGAWADASSWAAPDPDDFAAIQTLDDSVPDVMVAPVDLPAPGWAQQDDVVDGAVGFAHDGSADAAPFVVVADDEADGDWADEAEAEVVAELQGDVETAAFAAVGAGREMMFDEEVLRDLVRDIIREELAGSLGERITRNVRKLVRAEIARAVSVRELE